MEIVNNVLISLFENSNIHAKLILDTEVKR